MGTGSFPGVIPLLEYVYRTVFSSVGFCWKYSRNRDSWWVGQRSRYSDWLRARGSGDRIPMGARLSAPVQTGPVAHPASCTMDTGSFPGLKSGRDVMLAPHPLLVPWSWKSRAIPLLPLWAVQPVQSLSACTRVHFTFTFTFTFIRTQRKCRHCLSTWN